MSIQMNDPDNGDMENVEIDEGRISVEKTAHGDWPTIYRLPTFPPAVTECLARKDPRLTGRERSGGKFALITCLFHQMNKIYLYSKCFLLRRTTSSKFILYIETSIFLY